MKAIALLAILALPALASALTLDEAIAAAERGDPRLRALEAEAAAIALERRAAGRLLADDPTLDLGAGVRFLDEGHEVEWEASLEQPLRLGGQGRARSEAAEAAAARVAAARADRLAELRAQVRAAFTRLLAAEMREEILRTSADLAREAADAAEERLRAGRIARIERNGVLVEHARTARAAAEAAVATGTARAALRRLVALGEDVPLEAEGTLAPQATPPPERPVPDADEGPHPALVAAAEAEREAAARQRRADAGAWPLLRVGAAYEHEEGTDRVLGTLGFSLPFFDRNDEDRAAARIEHARSQARREETARALAAARSAAGARMRAAAAAMAAYEARAIDALDENLALATDAYRAGDLGFTEWLVLRRDALEGRLDWIDALEELALAQIEWDRATAAR